MRGWRDSGASGKKPGPILSSLSRLTKLSTMTRARRTPTELADIDRDALTEAIGKKVHKLATPELLGLAASLKVAVPDMPAPRTYRSAGAKPRSVAEVGSVLRGEGVGAVVSAADGLKALDAITVEDESTDWADSELLGAVELAQRLKVSRATIDNWRTGKLIIGFQKGLRNFIYPVRQFHRMRPIEGLSAVVEAFNAGEDAWEWLVLPNAMLEGQMPIDALRAGQIKPVIDAAHGVLDYA